MFSFLGEGHLGARLCPQQLNLTCWEANERHSIRSGRKNVGGGLTGAWQCWKLKIAEIPLHQPLGHIFKYISKPGLA